MARFLIRSVISTFITMLLVSAFLFLLMEVMGRSVSVQLLGVFASPEQFASFDNQLGLDEPAWQRYSDWLIGNDWRAQSKVGHPLRPVALEDSAETEWWADVNGVLTRWKMVDGEMVALLRDATGNVTEQPREISGQRMQVARKSFGVSIPKIMLLSGCGAMKENR